MRDGRRSLHRDLKSFFTRTNGVGEYSRQNSKCQGHEFRFCPACLRGNKGTSVAKGRDSRKGDQRSSEGPTV